MSNNPDQIRNDIERTREELEVDVDALAEKVRPSSVAHRQADRARGKLTSVKERVMGTAHHAQDKMHESRESGAGRMHEMGDRMQEGQQKAVQQIEGHPIAVGLMAFGAGLLISSLIPATAKERELGETAKDRAQGMKHEVAGTAKQVAKDAAMSGAKDVGGTAASAAKEVADTAKEAAKNVASEGVSAGKDVKDSAQDR